MPLQIWDVAAKAPLYAALLAAVGACAVRALLLPASGLTQSETGEVLRALAPVGVAAAALLVASQALHLMAHTVDVFGWPDALSWSSIRIVAFESRWRIGWRDQTLAAMALLGVNLLLSRRARASVTVPAGAGVVVCATMPFLGHAAGNVWRMVADAAHVLGACAWLGSLAVMALIRVRRPLRLALLRSFTPIALGGAALMLPAGIALAAWYVGTASNLWTTPYGRLLTLKVLLFLGIAAAGWMNWRRFTRERRGGAQREQLHGVGIELALVALVILATATLTEIAHP